MSLSAAGRNDSHAIEGRQPPDTELIATYQAGDQRAFERIYSRHVGAVYAYAMRILRNSPEAEEATQDTFVTAWAKLCRLRLAQPSVLPWLLVTCRYTCQNRLRALAHVRSNVSPGHLDETFADGRGTVEDSVEALELARILDNAVGALRSTDQAVYRLCIIDGQTYDEAAASLGLTNGAIRNRLSRVKATLRAEITILRGER
ncbi:sigma-70 family RNA polymerase sigma factor [uncultured Leifsonia sp.]|uniref:RNA polymerase sigma factor n=1 Tax=uncultured Leifsonia sp. TaxID=340359 RepID=UPI0028D571D7|nr:sigma-70 family RNA polymerase sigma factor [uncultured Leifsonia sp.]